jgi:uncharacterized protein (TIGR02391 family)
MREIFEEFRNPTDIIHLSDEDIGRRYIAFLKKRRSDPFNGGRPSFLVQNELLAADEVLRPPYSAVDQRLSRQQIDEIKQALSEGWSWLDKNGYVVAAPDAIGANWLILSRKAEALDDRAAIGGAPSLDVALSKVLHERLKRLWPHLVRREFDAAVREAFLEVEVAVREASKLPNNLVGRDLMRRAFQQKVGPLSDPGASAGEQDAVAELFAGATGTYRNKHSHAHVGLSEASEAFECLVVAGALLRLVDRAAARPRSSSGAP